MIKLAIKPMTICILLVFMYACGEKKNDGPQNVVTNQKNQKISVKVENLAFYQLLTVEGREYKINPSKYTIFSDETVVKILNAKDQDPIFYITIANINNSNPAPRYKFLIDQAENHKIDIYLKNQTFGQPLNFSYVGGKDQIKESYEILDTLMMGFYAPCHF